MKTIFDIILYLLAIVGALSIVSVIAFLWICWLAFRFDPTANADEEATDDLDALPPRRVPIEDGREEQAAAWLPPAPEAYSDLPPQWAGRAEHPHNGHSLHPKERERLAAFAAELE